MARPAEARLRRLERREAGRRTRYVVVEPGQVAPEVAAAPEERVFVVVTGVPRGSGVGEER